MDSRAANEYLRLIYGSSGEKGYVAMSYKDSNASWQEQQFSWPAQKKQIVEWATVHADADIFICPALRTDPHTRKAGDGKGLRWLWADMDWDKVPTRIKDKVKKRVNKIGTYVVASGTKKGDDTNCHVYVDLGSPVGVEEFTRLNTGLRDYLYADSKQTDNSLLRLPGTTNWKTEAGRHVFKLGGNGKIRTRDVLMKVKAFQNARVYVDAKGGIEWTKVKDLSGVNRKWLRRVRMPADEAVGRYGSRHEAVWAVAGDLHKAGYDSDTIHTLMDQFPPALEKHEDERNGYNWHKDIEKRLRNDRLSEDVALEKVESGDEGEVIFPELSDAEGDALALDEQVQKILRARDAKRAADLIEAERGYTELPPETSWRLSDALVNPPEPMPFLIEGMAGIKHNVIITAQYKTGKTSFLLGSLVSALVDGEDFLGQFPVTGQSTVGHWNCEMDPRELLDDYLRPVGMKNPDRLVVQNLRGHNVNILTPLGRASTVKWLKDNGVKVWTIDSLARLARMCGVPEKDNDEMLSVLMVVDQIKEEAGVDACFIIAHTGRAQMEEGQERARGATVIDDWPDARWIMTRDGEVRFLSVEGRGVAMQTTSLEFNEDTRRSVLGMGNKADVRIQGVVQTVADIVRAHPGIIQIALRTKVRERFQCSQRVAIDHIAEAMEGDFIHVRNEYPEAGRGKMVKKHYAMNMEKPEGGATPRILPADNGRMRYGGSSRKESKLSNGRRP